MTDEFRSVSRETAGNILPIVAAAIFMLAALVGGGVDMSRAYNTQNRLQSACDSGVLAGRRTITTNGYDTNAQANATKYFNVNYDAARQGTTATTFTTASQNANNTIVGTASTQLPMLIMQLFGKQSMTITVTCTSTMGVGNSDVTFVLDNTGSMGSTLPDGNTRIAALKTAVKNFYTSLNNTVAGTNARVRYAFVPFSATVNPGAALLSLNPAYLADQTAIQSRQAYFDTSHDIMYANYQTWVPQTSLTFNNTYNGSTSRYSSTAYSTQEDCINHWPAADWVDGTASTSTSTTSMRRSGSSTNDSIATSIRSTPQTLASYTCWASSGSYYIYTWTKYRSKYEYTYTTSAAITQQRDTSSFDHWDYRMVVYDTSTFKTFANVTTQTGSSGGNQTTSWDGCIEERASTPASSFSYASLSNTISPSAATDLDIDSAPGSSQASKWAPLWPDVAYVRSLTNNYGWPYGAGDSVLSTNGASVNSAGWTFCPAAMANLQAWTQTTFNSYVDTLSPTGDTYLDIGMLWGARVSSPTGIWGATVNATPPNQGNVGRHLIFMTDGDMNTYNFEQSAYGIETYDKRVTGDGTTNADDLHTARFRALCDAVKARGIRVWVIAYTTSITTDLSYCASANSSFTATNSSEINTAFQEIAKQIGELRISQ